MEQPPHRQTVSESMIASARRPAGGAEVVKTHHGPTRRLMLVVLLLLPVCSTAVFAAETGADTAASRKIKVHHAPGRSLALNLIPIPLDFGHVYNRHYTKFVLFSGVETAFLANTIAVAVKTSRKYGVRPISNATATERSLFYGTLAGFLATKAVSSYLCLTNARAIRDGRALIWEPAVSLQERGAVLGISVRWL